MASKLSKPLWILLTAVVVGFTALVVGRNLLHIWQTHRQLKRLRREGSLYREQIRQDSILVEELRYDNYLERYARLRFGMQRKGERVYQFEE
jgi:cell division protein FtsB